MQQDDQLRHYGRAGPEEGHHGRVEFAMERRAIEARGIGRSPARRAAGKSRVQ
jgi:hypothetical protein